MCNKLFAVLLVLGLVSSAMAVDADNILVQYSMDQADSMAGFMMNSATGAASIGPIGMAGETFLATNQGYAAGAGMFGDAVILSLDGALDPGGYDPNGAPWTEAGNEAGNIVDIEPEVESMEPDIKQFEDKTISMWVMQTEARNPELHHPGNDGTEYFLGSYFTYTTYIAMKPHPDPNVGGDVLGFRAGASSSTAGAAGLSDWITTSINMNEWYHVAMVLKNVPGAIGYNMQASFYVNGSLLAQVGNLCRPTDAFRWGAPRPWNSVAIGAYQCSETISTGHLTGGMVDDFAILNVPACGAVIEDIYCMGLQGLDISNVPEPTTIALLGLGGLALLRRKR
jgi:hypothetical protein